MFNLNVFLITWGTGFLSKCPKHLFSIYFSDQHVKRINKFRYTYLEQSSDSKINIPLLKNDTNNIIEYKNDIEIYTKKKKRYKFWDLIEK